MAWNKLCEQPKQKWVSIKHCAEYFDCSKSQIYALIKQPKYRDMAKRTNVGIRIELNLAEKLILGG